MGRLTLNVLLSFAQFERELSSERVRDKVAASRRKGKWTGGGVPLGYDVIDKKLTTNPTEADTVQTIFRRYIDLKCLRRLKEDLDASGLVSKRRKSRKGSKSGSVRLTYGPLAHLLKNRMYLGEIGHNGQWFAGEHKPIIDQTTFDRVQEIMKANAITRRHKRTENGAPLSGLVYDDHGNRMTPTFTVKRGIRYRFYISAALLKGHKDEVGSLPRISGPDLEAAVLAALRDQREPLLRQDGSDDRQLFSHLIERIEVSRDNVRLVLKKPKAKPAVGAVSKADELEAKGHIDIDWTRNSHGCLAVIDESQARGNEPDRILVQAVVRAHVWVKLLTEGAHTSIQSLAASISMHPKVVRKGIRLAFLAPEIIEAILSGRYLKSLLTVTTLYDLLSLSWIEQTRQLETCA
jgi:site-specific DNA recombinase